MTGPMKDRSPMSPFPKRNDFQPAEVGKTMRAIRAIGTTVCLAALIVILFGHLPTNHVAAFGLVAMVSGMSAIAANTAIRRRRLRSNKEDLDAIVRWERQARLSCDPDDKDESDE